MDSFNPSVKNGINESGITIIYDKPQQRSATDNDRFSLYLNGGVSITAMIISALLIQYGKPVGGIGLLLGVSQNHIKCFKEIGHHLVAKALNDPYLIAKDGLQALDLRPKAGEELPERYKQAPLKKDIWLAKEFPFSN